MLKYETLLQLKNELPLKDYLLILEDVNNTAHRVLSKPVSSESWPSYMQGELNQLSERIKAIKTKGR